MRFSKKQIEEFIENNMEDEVMDASKINIADEEEFEKLILAYDYSTRKNSRYMVLGRRTGDGGKGRIPVSGIKIREETGVIVCNNL